jgi:hypothetical protein
MSRFTLEANTQYNDWKGTCACDEFGAEDGLEEIFEATGEVKPNEVLIGWEFSKMEEFIYLAGYYHLESSSHPDGWIKSLRDDFKRQSDSLLVHTIVAEVTLEQFLKCFKRFNVLLLRCDIGIGGREAEDGR